MDAPRGILIDPKLNIAKPKDSSTNPIPNLTGPGGLYFDCHNLERIGAKTIIKKEFKIANHEAGTSVASSRNSLYNIHITIPQIMTKLVPRKKFDKNCLLYTSPSPRD